MSEQTEFPLSETGAPQAAAPSESAKPKRTTRKTKTAVEKPAAAEESAAPQPETGEPPKKRVVRKKTKAPDSSEPAEPANPIDSSVPAESSPRKRAVRKKPSPEGEAAPAAAEPQSGTHRADSPHPAQTPPQAPQSPLPAAAEPQSSPPANDQSPRSADAASPRPEGGDSDTWEGKRGRRFRNRRRGRDRFQRREDFSTPGDPANGEGAGQSQPAEDLEPVFEEGIVDVSGKGFGFLRKEDVNYDPSHTDTFITPEVVRNYNLRDGMRIRGQIRQGHRGPQLFKLTELEGEDPEPYKNLPVFEELTVLNPLERIRLETSPTRFTTRVIDLMAPIGKGTRGLLVAPPRTGKTTILQHIAEALAINHPEIKVILLLVDERPEEVTELRRALPHAEVIASSNDSDIKSHTRIAQLGIERAKRLVEMGKDVFVLMDSITRIGRAFNNAQSGKGRTMSGGVDSRALEIPRKLFAAARNTEEAGSLTIVGTALVETGSKMDELIFLEFKGTGNMELVLDRKISDQRIYPAADIFMSGTRREELLIPADNLHKINIIRRGLAGHKPFEAIERLLFFLQKYPTNDEMLAGIPG